MRPNLGIKMTAIAVGMVGTAGVAAAATVGSSPAAKVAIEPAAVETEVLDQLPVDLGDIEIPDVTTLPTPTIPTPTIPTTAAPTLPSLPIPGVEGLPVDPTALANQAVGQVAALLPSPEALKAAVLDCVSDITALSPVPAPSMGNPLGFLTGLLGSLGASSTPKLPDPAVVQAAITSCVSNVLGVLPDPTALATALTNAFGPAMPAPIAALVAQLTGNLPTGDPAHLIDLVTGLVGASGSPAGLLERLTDAIDDVVPAPLDELISFPLSIVNQVFATLGLS